MAEATENSMSSLGTAAPAWSAVPGAPTVRYWICLTLLVATAAAGFVLSKFYHFRKEAVPLKSPLPYFDLRKLAPAYVRHPDTDRLSMSDEVLETLGTHEFLQVYLTDTRKPASDPTAIAQVFITYYTGKPDLVPHVPDECYLAGGFNPIVKETATVFVPGVGAPQDEIPVRLIVFETSRQRRMMGAEAAIIPVLYFFHTNGQYATTRSEVRFLQSNPFQRHAYYAKVEVTFPQTFGLPAAEARAASLAAVGPLLEKVLPVLFADHFDLSQFGAAPTGGAEDSVRERG